MKLQRLRGRKTSEKLLEDGTVWKGRTMVIRWMKGPPRNFPKPKEGLFVGTLASTRLHKSAVRRNRMRRRCREVLRVTVRDIDTLPTMQLLISPRSRSLSCDYAEILADVRAFLSRVS